MTPGGITDEDAGLATFLYTQRGGDVLDAVYGETLGPCLPRHATPK